MARQRVQTALNRLALHAVARLFHAPKRDDLCRLGSDYGGWWVPAGELGPSAVCYCAGVGEDTTFDDALIQEFGCRVVALDPTPRAIAHVSEKAGNERFRFLPVGLAGSDRVARFWAPRDPTHVSHSIANLQHTTDYFDAPVKRLSTIALDQGDESVDLLKLDIEGAEHEVIADLCSGPLRPRVVCVEFDQPDSLARIARSVRGLRRAGYGIAKIERFNLTFVLGP